MYIANVMDGPTDSIKECGATAGVIFPVGERSDTCEGNAIMEHFHFGIKEDGRNKRLTRFFLLLFDGAIEAPDGIFFEPAHGAATVEDEYDFSESFFHDCLRAAISAALMVTETIIEAL